MATTGALLLIGVVERQLRRAVARGRAHGKRQLRLDAGRASRRRRCRPRRARAAGVLRAACGGIQPSRRAGRRRRRRSARLSSRRSARRRTRTILPSRPSFSRFRSIALAAAVSDSTNIALSAPRDSASRPSAPEPAKRSSTRAPSTGPRIAKIASRTRSDVGLVLAPFGAKILAPLCEPPTILTRAVSRHRRARRSRRSAGLRSLRARRPRRGRSSSSGRSAHEPRVPEVREAGLARAEQLALTPAARDRPRPAGSRRSSRTSASSRATAVSVSSSFGRETSRQYDCSAPRPTRPRSWCSWASPKRSASCTIMIVAFGTSTPTSITVVATRTSSSPALKRAMRSRRSAGRSWPCMQPTRNPRSSARCSRSASCSAALASIATDSGHERADDVRLPSRLEMATEAPVRLGAPLGRHPARDDRPPACGQLRDLGHG